MMIPESYAKDTQAIAGRVLDHDISLSEVDLQANLAYPFSFLFELASLFFYFISSSLFLSFIFFLPFFPLFFFSFYEFDWLKLYR